MASDVPVCSAGIPAAELAAATRLNESDLVDDLVNADDEATSRFGEDVRTLARWALAVHREIRKSVSPETRRTLRVRTLDDLSRESGS